MAEKRQLELHLLRVVPHPLRDDFMTVGVVMVEVGGEFAEVRFTRDWKRVECFAPELEAQLFERLEAEVRRCLKDIRGRQDLLRVLEERFGAMFDVGPTKAVESRDPAAEIEVIARDYLAPMQGAERAQRTGRVAIVGKMEEAFADAGVLELLQRDVEMTEFTGENDPFRVDFGFRVGRLLRMFQALALSVSREPAVTLAYRYTRIQEGIRKRGQDALLTAIIGDNAIRAKGEIASGVAMLKANEIPVRSVDEMGQIADEVRRELRG